MLFKSATLEGIRDGRVSLAFRRWPKARVKAGSEVRTALGVVGIVTIEAVTLAAISEADARKAGHATRAALLAEMRRFGTGQVYKIGVRFAGRDPRASLRESPPTEAEDAEISRRLDRLDKASSAGAWTKAVITLIAGHPAVRAADLAARLGCETQVFKIRVRKLKDLGLTESLEVGYRLSPRGTAWIRSR
ncbi:MAG: hypothetical protein AB7F09_04555 [Parvibaculaceae bacterium]